MKAVLLVIASNGVLYLQMKSVGSHSTSRREEEEKKGRTRLRGCSVFFNIMFCYFLQLHVVSETGVKVTFCIQEFYFANP
jgi:hypothetical protein